MTTPRTALTPPLLRGVESFTPLLAHSLNGFAVVELASARYAYVSDSLCHLLELDKHVLLGCGCTAVRCVLSRARARGWIRSRLARVAVRSASAPTASRRTALTRCTAASRARRRRKSALVFPDDRAKLVALLVTARERAAANLPTNDFVRVRHACGADVARTGTSDSKAQRYIPVEIKACADVEYAFLVFLDARVPERLESLLPDFLLSTSASRGAQQPAQHTAPRRAAAQRAAATLGTSDAEYACCAAPLPQATTCARRAAASSPPWRCC